jgi:putative restriction endonuclease
VLWVENTGSMRSFGNLSAAVSYAEIDQNLALLLLNKDSREILKQALLKTSFPNSSIEFMSGACETYVDDLKNEMKDTQGSSKSKLLNLKRNLDPETYKIEVYNRGTLFRREIVKLYNETCCISGVRVSAPFIITMVDACHIMPFSGSFDNSLTNGIALCPNLHRSFDRGLISVNDDYEVVLSKSFKENLASDYSFSRIEGKTILLPLDQDFNPSIDAFK